MPKDQIPFLLTENETYFPNPELALTEPDGLLAIGGDLSPNRLLAAYKHGIFPWYSEEPILWWSPNPRTVIYVADIHISTSLKKTLRHHQFDVKMDENFAQVIRHCAAPRHHQSKLELGTWITMDMQNAYIQLHELGYAHSIEIYANHELIAGVYGISLGRFFFGESMFSKHKDASKVALVYLARQLQSWGFEFIDCQMWSAHLASMGAITITRDTFLEKVSKNNHHETRMGKWELDPGINIW